MNIMRPFDALILGTTVADKQSQQVRYLGTGSIFWHSVFRILFSSSKYVEKHISEVFPMSGYVRPNFWPQKVKFIPSFQGPGWPKMTQRACCRSCNVKFLKMSLNLLKSDRDSDTSTFWEHQGLSEWSGRRPNLVDYQAITIFDDWCSINCAETAR